MDMELRFRKFNGSAFKLLVAMGIRDSNNFPGITVEYLEDARAWLNEPENWQWILDQRQLWESQAPTIPEPTEPEEPPEEPVEPQPIEFSEDFHHTQTAGPDGGQSLVLGSEQGKFDRCEVAGHNLKYHGKDEGRHSYWNMQEWYDAPIICYKDGRAYVFRTDRRAHKGMVYGKHA